MKKLALLVTLLGLTMSAHANELIPITASCKTIETNKEFLDRFKEYPFAGGPGVIRMPNGEFVQGIGKIYVDPKEKGFTVLIEFTNLNKSCVLLMGHDFAPLASGDSA